MGEAKLTLQEYMPRIALVAPELNESNILPGINAIHKAYENSSNTLKEPFLLYVISYEEKCPQELPASDITRKIGSNLEIMCKVNRNQKTEDLMFSQYFPQVHAPKQTTNGDKTIYYGILNIDSPSEEIRWIHIIGSEPSDSKKTLENLLKKVVKGEIGNYSHILRMNPEDLTNNHKMEALLDTLGQRGKLFFVDGDYRPLSPENPYAGGRGHNMPENTLTSIESISGGTYMIRHALLKSIISSS